MSAPGALSAPSPLTAGSKGIAVQLALAVVSAGYAVGAAVGWGSRDLAQVMGDFGLSAAGLLAAVSCGVYARTRPGREQPAWLLFSFSSLMGSLGNAVWGWHEVILDEAVPSPSLADFAFLCFAPPAIVGLLMLAKRPVSRSGWVCLALDSWLIAGSLITLSWSLALAQTARTASEELTGSVPQAALGLAYPILDIALVSTVLVLHFRRSAANRSAVNTAIAALALTVLSDALFTSPLLRASYHSGQFLDAGWFAGALLLAYAPWGARRHPAGPLVPVERPHSRPVPHPRRFSPAALTPYAAAAVCVLGILFNAVEGRKIDRVVLFAAGTVVLALLVRQGITLFENMGLAHELAQKENHFRSLVQGSSDVIMIAAPTGTLRYVSPAAAGVYGREAEDLVGTELSALIHPEDLGPFVHEIRRFLAAPAAEEPTTRVECRFESGAGAWLHVESTINRHQGGLLLNSRDVTERVRLQAQLQHSAEHDALTDLPNRSLFTRRVRGALSGRRAGDAHTAVLFIDLDGFKAVNDTIGHQAGDELLVEAARRLQDSLRTGDTAARLGGDEFAALVLGDPGTDRPAREAQVGEIADRLRLALSRPYRIAGTEVRVAASIGVAFADPGITPADLMRNADLAMYRAKAGGKDRVEMHRPGLGAETLPRVPERGAARGPALAAVGRSASRLPGRPGPGGPTGHGGAGTVARVRPAPGRPPLPEGEFTLLHQPVVALADGQVTAIAAQPRWRSTQGILFTPADFLRSQDRSGRSLAPEPSPDPPAGFPRDASELARRLLEDAVEMAADRHRAGHHTPVVIRIGVRRLLERDRPLGSVEAVLTRHGLPPGGLILELADNDPRVPVEELERRLSCLRRSGVRIALDGIGGGYGALGALRRLPLDLVTLDRGLVEGVVESARLHKITSGLLRIANDLGMQSVADGIELPEQALALRAMGCTHARGTAFSGPLDEYRLRRALVRGSFPLSGPDTPAGPLKAGVTGSSRIPHRGSHNETPVPPT
ncbi:diguanylate cyclase domain-containing protein [Streptomyces sp. BI20]|uniref:diguanylate cyclase domain-containing protein n=1 Tax=Streptomyces sp. BI20 TaxID=3403460 RepID=UPI003C752A2A